MAPDIRHPSARRCERCGRAEEWDDDAQTWLVSDEVGVAYCIHEWDINGSFLPVEDAEG